MVIYDINGKKLLDAILTKGAEHEQELSKSDFVRLSWDSDVKITVPAGSYIIPFGDGLKYRLLNSYTPSETEKDFKYTPEFHHPLMWLSRVPFLYKEGDLKQQEWSYDGLTATALQYVCDAINEAFGITDDTQKFTYTLCGTVDGSVSFSVSSNDILSVISSIAQACKDNSCEWHLSWEHRALYFGQIAINMGEEVPTLKVHDNIQTASVSESKEDYYNCFYPQGSTRNMSRKAQVGTGNVATLARLGLNTTDYPDGCIYVGADGKIITKAQFEESNAVKQTLALSFDDIYPHIDLYAYNIRKRTRYLKNETTNEYELDSKGNKKIYTVWYMRLAYCTTTKDTSKSLINTTTDKDKQGNTVTHYWYDYEIDKKKQVLQGYELKGTFKVNTHTADNKYDALSQSLVGQPNGQDGFELYYHEAGNPIPASAQTGDSGINVLKGDYEIVMYQNGDTIIPSNEEDGLIPHGNPLPDLTCNIVVLFNIVMGEQETKLAQEELAKQTVKEIARRTRDNNNYTASSNAVAFAEKNPNLYIGQKVVFDDGFDYQLPTRVIKLVTKLDYPIIQEITVGNQAVKGTISQLKEDVSNILSGNYSGGGLNQSQINGLIKNYVDRRFLSKLIPDTANGQIRFIKGLKVGDGEYGIDNNGKARLSELLTDKASIDKEGHVTAESLKSDDFKESGTLLDGKGFGIYRDANGTTHVSADIFEARKKAYLAELAVRKFTFTSGDTGYTSAGCKIDFVKRTGNAFRCYFLAEDDDTRISNDFHVGDQAMARTANIIDKVSQAASNRYYWRLVISVDTEPVELEDGRLYHYIDLSDTKGTVTLTIDGAEHTCVGYDTSIENNEPKAGDKIVQLGSQTDVTRQYAYIVYVSTGQQVAYDGINDYDLGSHAFLNIGGGGIEITTNYLNLHSGDTGRSVNIVSDCGQWVSGTVAGHYERYSHNGSLWLCNVGKGQTTTEEPSEDSPVWIKEVSKGDDPVIITLSTDSGGQFLRNGQGRITLRATATLAGVDVTDDYPKEAYSWTRQTGNNEWDEAWNSRHARYGNTCTVTAEDVFKKAVFSCILDLS